MTLHALEAMDGRQRGQLLRDQKGRFTTIAGRNADIDKEISEYYKKINHLKKFTSENPDLKVLIDDKKAEIAKLESEQRLNNFSRRGINERTKAYEEAMKKQGMKGKELKEQVARYEEGLKEERRVHFDKLKGQNNAKNIVGEVKIGEKAKESKGFFSRIGAALKANKGKIALATAVVAIGAGVVAMCSGNKSNEADFDESKVTPPQDTAPKKEPKLPDEKPAEEVPVVDTPAEETEVSHEVKKGECFWNIAKENLINKYKAEQKSKGEAVDENYKPSNAEILEETNRLMRKNKYDYDDKHYNSVPPLQIGDKISLAA
ncbi:hypothetical protein J6E39_06125 [bacterium]|nr:hypothetical protein [bacterium]